MLQFLVSDPATCEGNTKEWGVHADDDDDGDGGGGGGGGGGDNDGDDDDGDDGNHLVIGFCRERSCI